METKKYSSYAQIESELAILKVEREIHYKKILLSIDKTKESIFPFRAVSFFESRLQNLFSGNYGTIFKIVIPFFIKWFYKKKSSNL